MSENITVEVTVKADIQKVWDCWTKPEHIIKWNFASDDWECPKAENDLKEGGDFSYRMSAKDKSFGFDFGGTYTKIVDKQFIEYHIGDGRLVEISFEQTSDGIKITETFEAEETHSIEQQRSGWQSILNNFKKHAEE